MIDISFSSQASDSSDNINNSLSNPLTEILSVVIGIDNLTYGKFDKSNTLTDVKLFTNIDFENPDSYQELKEELIKINAKSTNISYTGKPFLHSPSESAGELIKFFPAFGNKELIQNKLTDQNIVVDFGKTKSQKKFVAQTFDKNINCFHISTILANYFYPYRTDQLVAHIDNNKVHIMYAKPLDFFYYNQFECKSESDYLYFITLAYKSMNLDQNITPLALSGKVDKQSAIYKLLHDYIRDINLTQSNSFKVSDYRFMNKSHYYLDLIATSQCV
ncbi:MAG: DUF3822 family protein [Saprospiraceae bacterium]